MKRYDHVALALSRLPTRLRKPKWMALAAALARSRQRLEEVLQLMAASMSIDVAEGFLLNQIGAIVDQPRDTADDVVYRRRIRAKIALNRSSGLHNDILRIARLVVNNSTNNITIETWTATAVLHIDGTPGLSDAAAEDLAAFAQRAASAGVRVIVESNTGDGDEDMFVLGCAHDVADGLFGAGETDLSMIYGAVDTWPERGFLKITGGSYSGERFAYARTGPSWLRISPPLPFDIGSGEIFELDIPIVGKGLGDATEPGQPSLVAYTSPGTTGGRLADAR